MHKYQRGYISPSHKAKKQASISIRVSTDDRELLDAHLESINVNKSEWGRWLVMKELEIIKSGSVDHEAHVYRRYTAPTLYTQKTGLVKLVTSIFDYFKTQKKPEIAAQALNAQHHKGH